MRYITIYFLSTLISLAGCHKPSLLTYHTKNDIFFADTLNYNYTDSLGYSFARMGSKDDTLSMDSVIIHIQIVGKPALLDRDYKMEVDQSLSTAIADKHYQLPDGGLYIPTDSIGVSKVLKIFKPADLYEKSVKLVLRLSPNENFDTLMKMDYTNAPGVPMTVLSITIANILPKPSNWDEESDYLGSYSREKLTLIADLFDLPWNYSFNYYGEGQIINFSKKTQTYLNEQAAAGNIIRERDGSIMIMGPDAQ